MKKVLIGALFLAGCVPNYVRIARESTPKTVSIFVKTTVEELVISFENGRLNIRQEPVKVRVGGAGVFITTNGHVLTCAHLFNVGISSTITVENVHGQTQVAQLLYKDDRMDLALVKISGETPHCAVLTHAPLEVGQEVLAVGNPEFLGFTVTKGMISYVRRDFGEMFRFTQTDAPINPGNSGGPLFNTNGELIGIVSAKMGNSDGLGFAVAPETIKKFLNTFKGL